MAIATINPATEQTLKTFDEFADEDVEPGVGDVDHRDLTLGLATRDGAPQGRLAAAGGSGDAD